MLLRNMIEPSFAAVAQQTMASDNKQEATIATHKAKGLILQTNKWFCTNLTLAYHNCLLLH